MIFKSTGFALLVFVVPCFGWIPGSRGSIDFRYPDYIVDPLPECPSEGVFPHPRNCSWFYRCTDVYQIGYYRRFYFECEPGTVFSDKLDQCIHPFNPKYPCATQEPMCSSEIYLSRCKIYYCPTHYSDYINIGNLCESGFSKCSDGSKKHYCQGPDYYDVKAKKCVISPHDRGCVDEIPTTSTTTTPSTTTTVSTTTPTTTTPTTTTEDCYYSVVGCKKYKCPSSLNEETFCRKRFMTCNKNVVTFLCDSDQFYSLDNTSCVNPPSESGCVEVVDSTVDSGVATVPVGPESLTFSFSVVCSPENTRPRTKTLVDYFCKNYSACENDVVSQVELCEKYLQCLYNEDTEKWSANVLLCPPRLFFSFDKDACVQKPKEIC